MRKIECRGQAVWQIQRSLVFFLDALGILFAARPSVANAAIDLDDIQINRDMMYMQSYGDVVTGMRNLVEQRQADTTATRLNLAETTGF